jgi:hypothetical protein
VSPKTLAVAGLSAIAIAASGCTGGDDVDTSSEAYKQGYELVHSHGIPGDLASGSSTVDEVRRVCKSLYTAWAGTPELRTAETKRDYDAGCDDGLASLGDPPAQSTVDMAELSAAFKERFGPLGDEAWWYHHFTGINVKDGGLVLRTDLDPKSDFDAVGAICGDVYRFAIEKEAINHEGYVRVKDRDGVGIMSCG